ncbi:TraB/GumN family protein [Massilia aurea]|uniref:TraB/GumN family protein n=1 Tax=Massilia aurea TaxID=373040 RepID=UPI0034626080
MRALVVPVLCLSLLAAPARAQSLDAVDATPAASIVVADGSEPAPEQIHVVAQRPGPGMWKVTKGDHVLWVFGTYAPLTKDIAWRSQQVENAIRNSQEYLAPPGATIKPGFFKTITLLPSLIGVRKNPDGAQLRDVMPQEDYARWRTLKAKYLPTNSDVERERPIFAAQTLSEAARKQAGLVSGNVVRKKVMDLVKQNKLTETSSTFVIPSDNAGALLKNFKKTTLADAACLTQTMATLEADIDAASARANAWAKGDIDAMRALNHAERKACFESLVNSAAFDAEPEVKNMEARANAKWLVSAENALAANTSTFAMLPIDDVFDPKGVIAALAAKGYVVEQPD